MTWEQWLQAFRDLFESQHEYEAAYETYPCEEAFRNGMSPLIAFQDYQDGLISSLQC